jgi:predicted RNase H-like nuclease
MAPPRPVWDAADYPAANARCRQLTGQGLSRQSYGLLRRMVEAEAFRDARPRHDVVEVHPELVFRTLAGEPLADGKKTADGQQARRSLLAGVGIVPPAVRPAATHDVLDAAAVAWCAHRVAAGDATHLPDPADQHDHCGRPIVIWRG